MLKTTLAGLRAHKLRLLLTAVAITLGVGFISGTFVLTDTMNKGVAKTFAQSADKVDVAVLPAESSDDGLPASLLKKLRGLPGVTDAQGAVKGEAALVGKDGKTVGDYTTMGMSVPTGRLLRYEVDKGRPPSGAGETVLDSKVAKREGFTVGDTVTVLDDGNRPHRFTVVGLVDFGIDQEASIFGAVGFDPATAARMTGEKSFREIDIAGTVSPSAVKAATGPGHRVYTGPELGAKLAKSAGADTEVIRTGLLIFALVAMLVSALVIYNTFAILVAQRMREMALLRCVGATRRQIFGGVLTESAAVGLTGSLLGIGAGVGLGQGALVLISDLDGNVSVTGPSLAPRTVLVGLAVGVAVTVLSALLPARAATRVAPVAALRADAEPGGGRFRLGAWRTAAAVLLAAAGLAIGVLAALGMEKGEAAMFAVAFSGCVFFLAVVAAMPALVRPLGRLAGAVPARLGGVPGRLAVANAQRAPRRTATTTIALTVGVGLMSLFAVVGASSKATASHQLDEQFPVQFRIATHNGEPLPRALGDDLRKRPEVEKVVEVRDKQTKVDGEDADITTVTASAWGGVAKPKMKSGALTDLKQGTVFVDDASASSGWTVGRTLQIRTRSGSVPVKISGVYEQGGQFHGLVVPEADFARYFGAVDPSEIFVKSDDAVPGERVRRAVDQAAQPYPAAKVESSADFQKQVEDAIDMVLMVFGGLLGLAIVIALFGIANTLTLSVVERTRESALLRALGLTKRQLRRMLSIEAVVMAVIGAVTGVALGIVFGLAATSAMSDSVVFALPYLQIVGFVLLAGLAGTLAAVMPARRAARTSIVESLAHD
ncbi:putative ABC transport system permease protein [Actinomadura meyerae]|uniref:Putative ABC transport system permease protein n=1 Tax=Actinomadura meyerae TaxID=240840 RepID=A0A239MUH4_9ACTN|nr:FtsX-like permease family protein [Actinomadura meyerae]SNT46457.1 putative ABC transport system permease protein [Actinomadura meyerae]